MPGGGTNANVAHWMDRGTASVRTGPRDRRRRSIVWIALLTLAATLMAAPVGANPGGLQTDCTNAPATKDPSHLMPGMMGTGYTAIQGAQPMAFDVEILGVLPNGIGIGLDMILARASGPVIEAAGGVAAGMSGSPIYIDGKLVGALAYGLSGSDYVFGITPADAMAAILEYPATTPPAAPSMNMVVSGQMLGTAGDQMASHLPLPTTIAGVSPERHELLDRIGLSPTTIVPQGGGGGGTGGGGETALPGEPLSAVLSLGDISFFATGTATLCRGDQIIAFGHPANFSGESTLGMATADIVTIIDDESGLFGNYKIANLGSLFGRIDRDHLAGIRGIDGEIPSGIPITSTVTFDELARSRMGATQVLGQDFLSGIAFSHLFANIDAVFDAIGDGSSEIMFTIDGTRENGTPFTVDRSNVYSSEFDISFESSFEVPNFIDTLLFNPYEDVEITRVAVDQLNLNSEPREVTITDVVVSTATGSSNEGFLTAAPGEVLDIEATLVGGGTETTQIIQLQIPDDIVSGFGSLIVSGGQGEGGFFFEEPPPNDFPGDAPGSFDEVLEELANRPSNADLVARLELFDDAAGPVSPRVIEERVRQDRVVRGNWFFDISVFEEPDFPPGFNVPLQGPGGTGNAYLEFGEFDVYFDLFIDSDSPVTAAHIHRGFPGEDGPVVVDLDWTNLGSMGVVAADPEILAEILAEPFGFYVNVHSETWPDGAMRGQIAELEPEPFPEEPPSEEPPGETPSGGYVDNGGQWFLPGMEPFWFGVPGDIPFLGDWDGDGDKTPGLYRPSTGYAYVRNTNDTGMADVEWYIGIPGDRPMVGDWDGDGADSFGVYRSSEAMVYLRNGLSTGFADIEFMYGMDGDIPFAGNFNGDDTDDIGVFRDGRAYIRFDYSAGTADLEMEVMADDVIVGDWNQDGIDELGAILDGVLYAVDGESTLQLGPADGAIRRS